jgi:predicted RND superfamily exporter protein
VVFFPPGDIPNHVRVIGLARLSITVTAPTAVTVVTVVLVWVYRSFRLIIVVFFPVAYPISVVLDGVLGHEGQRQYTRRELAVLMDVQV